MTHDSEYGTVPAKALREPSGAPHVLAVHGALVAVYVCFGGGAVVSKFGVHVANPIVFELSREMLSGPLLLFAAYFITRQLAPSSADHWWILLAGFCFFVNQCCFFVGLKFGDPITAATWQSSLPVFTTFLAILAGYEGISLHKLGGIALAVCGATFVVLLDGTTPTPEPRGLLWKLATHTIFFTGVVGCSFYIVVTKGLVAKYPPVCVAGWVFMISAVFFLIIAVFLSWSPTLLRLACSGGNAAAMDVCVSEALQVPSSMVYPLIYEVGVNSLVAWFLMVWANRYAKASVVSIYTVAQPLASAGISGLLVLTRGASWSHSFGIHPPGVHHLVGLLLISAGLLVMFTEGTIQETEPQLAGAACRHLNGPRSCTD